MLIAIRQAARPFFPYFFFEAAFLAAPASCSRGRRRWLIVLAGAFLVAYAVSVLSYVFSLPDIGLRCAFDTTLNRVYSDYLAPDGPELKENDVIVKLGGAKDILDWRLRPQTGS